MIQLIHFVLFSFACKGNTFLRSAQKECGCRIMLYTKKRRTCGTSLQKEYVLSTYSLISTLGTRCGASRSLHYSLRG